MITSVNKTKNKKMIAVYIKDGITIEECRIVYDLSQYLGVDIILGSDKILKPAEIINDLRSRLEKLLSNDKLKK
ncbi:hypothetical protein HERIO_547 [Hepatospora eriocheir]|nr:hypothetical protein HERIO_547 [Hepatospora eriocheir]